MQKPDQEGRPSDRLLRLQQSSDDAVLDRLLASLNDVRREQTPFLHLTKQWIDVLGPREGAGKDVCSRHCILDRKVDPDSADRRHGVRRISDRD